MRNTKFSSQQIIGSRLGVLICTRHFAPVLAVLLANAITSIHDALIELSKRSESRADKPVIKLIFDRGNPKQIVKNHQRVTEDQWADLGLPTKEEVKFLHLEVMVWNFLSNRSR